MLNELYEECFLVDKILNPVMSDLLHEIAADTIEIEMEQQFFQDSKEVKDFPVFLTNSLFLFWMDFAWKMFLNILFSTFQQCQKLEQCQKLKNFKSSFVYCICILQI